MADAQPDPPTKPNPPQPKPAKKAAPDGTATSAEVASNMPNFNFGELVDLALCAPEIGAVNFNILRLLLRQMLDKTGIEKQSVKMTDLEAHQVDNFRNYVQGAAIASPMPGVLKIAPQGPGGGAGKVYGVKPGTTGQESNKALVGASSKTPRTPKLPPTETASYGDIPEKVARLEKHIEALYQLPGNAEIIERAKANAMSVNDMWQVIQLNNRIAAAEAAIQKMASLIEDLARNMNRVKGDTKTIKKDTADLTLTHSDLQLQGQSLSDKCEEFGTVVKSLRDDMDKIKKGWKKDRDLLEKSLGVDLGRVPSFMKTKQDRDAGTTGPGPDDESAEQFERGTQTFVHLKEKEKQQQKSQPPRPPPKPQGQKKVQQGPQQDRRDAETSGQQPSKTPQSSKGQAEQQQRQPKAKNVEDMIAPETIADMSPEDIAKQVTIEEVMSIPPEVFKQMTPEQKKALRDIHKSAAQQKPKPKPPLGVKNMTVEELENLDPGKIMDHMSYEEAAKLAPEVLEKMSDKQKEAVQKVIKQGEKAKQPPSGKKKSQGVRMQQLGVASMNAEELAATSPSTIISRMNYDEAVKIPPEVLDKMTNEQRDAVRKVIDDGRPPSEAAPGVEIDDDAGASDDDDEFLHYLEKRQHRGTLERKWQSKSKKTGAKTLTFEELGDIAKVAPQDLASSISPEMALAIPSDELQRRFTPEQIQEIERLKSIAPHHVGSYDDVFPDHVADMTPAELVENLTDNQLLEMTSDQLSVLSPDQQVAVKDAIRKSRIAHAAEVEDFEGEEGVHTDVEEEEMHDDKSDSGQGPRKSKKDRQSQNKQPPQKQHGHHKHHKHHHDSQPEGGHPHVDIVPGPIPNVGEPLPPMTLEEYMSALPPEEAANLAADAVQRELQKQYGQLQGMQRQLAQDIQDKMEFIYQKLLKEIAKQQASTSPYMAVGDADQCLGPGICTGYGMPAGIAVVKFPDVKKDKALVPAGYAVPGAEDITGKVCPGPGICPGNAACSYCHGQSQPLAQGSAEAQMGLQGSRATEKKGGESVGLRGVAQGVPLSEMDEALLREMKSLMMLDLEKIREEMRSKKFGVFDEQDVAERLGAVWEALKILKHNEEALAIKIARQDALLKKLPIRVIEKLSKIPDENLDAMATGQFQKPMYLPDGSPLKRQTQKDIEDLPKSPMKSIATAVDKEDIQTLFNNLANVIGECAEQKEKIDQIADTTRVMESGMVTKQMLLDALSDKADKGLFNTKVSYDEFGNTVDELHTQLHNLMVEGYQRNENWKKVTSELAGDLVEKLDKVELAPIKSFFKAHLKNLDEKVKTLSRLVEEPDPAGTRKRLLRDYNCLSCDRMVNISGVTNGPTLPIIGPIPAGHQTASRRALDLHRMRMRKQFDPDTKNLNALERQSRGQKCRTPDPNQMACDTDVIHALNRYTGGSHTAINTADRVATQRRSAGSRPTNPAPIMCGGDPPNPPCAETVAAAAGGENVEG